VFDVGERKITNLKEGKVPIYEPGIEQLVLFLL
jgi:UDP-glucose 6-dehydrogenase